MKVRHIPFKIVAVGALIAAVALLAAHVSDASNMGFKMNKVIQANGFGNIGTNLVSLPYRNPYVNAQDVCAALGLTAGTGVITQLNATTGNSNVHNCGGANPFPLTLRVGIIVENPSTVSGILVGSHQSGQSIGLAANGFGSIGLNYVPVPYHTTAANMQDLCVQAGFGAGAGIITWFNPATGNPSVHTCGGANAPALILGEAVIVEKSNPADPPSSFVPAHF